MFLLNEPSEAIIRSFLARQQKETFSYPEVGASFSQSPAGYNIDHHRVQLGRGEATFNLAKLAIQSWKMFDLGWCRIYPPAAPIEIGTTVAIVINHFGFWSLNSSRVVYLLREQGEVHRYGFAYGTLREHGEIGEERFSVEWKRDEESVWYDLYAFSRPGHIMARIGYPLSRRLQKRFARDSQAAMMRAVNR